MSTTTKISNVLLEELETLQDSLLDRVLCSFWNNAGHKSKFIQANEIHHDCKDRSV